MKQDKKLVPSLGGPFFPDLEDSLHHLLTAQSLKDVSNKKQCYVFVKCSLGLYKSIYNNKTFKLQSHIKIIIHYKSRNVRQKP